VSDWAETRAAELLAGGWPPEGGSVSWLRYRSNVAKGLREAEARGRASMKEEAAKVAIEMAEKDRALSGEGRSVEQVTALARAIGAQRVAAVVLALKV
jgi:hypothetical protein